MALITPRKDDKILVSKFDQYKEHLLGINEFNKPKVVNGPIAVCYKIIELILMRPGTYPTRPYMGIGLVENFRYTFTDKIDELQALTEEQIRIYLPEFDSVKVTYDTVLERDKILIIHIFVDDAVYTVTLDTDRKTLTWLIDQG